MNSDQKPVLQVAAKAAIINSEGKVLILREAATGKNNTKIGHWGLIGGRIEPGETFIEGLAREVMEETGLRIQIDRPLYVGEWRPVIRNTPHQIIAVFMLCKNLDDKIYLSNEHDSYRWIDPKKRTDYKMMEPDCFVLDEIAEGV